MATRKRKKEQADLNTKDIFAGSFRAKDKLCINETCVTEAELQVLLQNAAAGGSGSGSGSGSGNQSAATCTDGIQNQNETSVDTGGVCTVASTLESIAITTPATKLSYTVGDALDITRLEVTGTYSDANTKVETVTATDVSGFDSLSPITGQVLTVTIGGKTATYSVDIVAAP